VYGWLIHIRINIANKWCKTKFPCCSRPCGIVAGGCQLPVQSVTPMVKGGTPSLIRPTGSHLLIFSGARFPAAVQPAFNGTCRQRSVLHRQQQLRGAAAQCGAETIDLWRSELNAPKFIGKVINYQ
jgi:hypothetical protein